MNKKFTLTVTETINKLTDQSVSVKEKILEAALQIYTMKPIHKVAVNDIAKLAGVSKGVIFYHFKTKDNLEKETLIYSIQKYFGFGIDNITDVVHTSLRIAAENPALVRFWQYVYEKEIHSGDPEFIENFFKGFMRTLSELLTREEVEDPDKTAIVLMALLDGLAIYSTFMDLGKIEDFESIILDFIKSRRLKK